MKPARSWASRMTGPLASVDRQGRRSKRAARRVVARQQVQRPLTHAEIRTMLGSGRVHPYTLMRAMGAGLPAPMMNPSRRRPTMAYAYNPEWLPANYGDDSRKKKPKRGVKAASRKPKRPLRRPKQGEVLVWAAAPHRQRRSKPKSAPRKPKPRAKPRGKPRGKPRFVKKGRSRSSRVRARPRYVMHEGRRYYSVRTSRGTSRGGRFAPLRALYSGKYVRRARGRKTKGGKHLRAVVRIPKGSRVAGLVRINPRTGALIMPSAIVANPRRRRRRASNPRRHHHARRKNPRRRRARRASNPGGGFMAGLKATAKNAVFPGAAAAVVGTAAGILDTKISNPIAATAAKVGLGLVTAALLRKKPMAAYAAFGAAIGTAGYGFGVKLGSGLVAPTKGAMMKGLAELASEDGEVAALLAGAGVSDIGDLYNMGEVADDESAMADLVEGLGDDDDMGDDDVGDLETE